MNHLTFWKMCHLLSFHMLNENIDTAPMIVQENLIRVSCQLA